MGRRRWNKKHPDKAKAQQHQRRPEEADPPVRLLALHPNRAIVGVGIGNRLTLVDYGTGQEVNLAAPQQPGNAANPSTAAAEPATGTSAPAPQGPHAGFLRVLHFSPDGRFLLTGADDKAVRLWALDQAAPAAAPAGRCVAAWRTPKKSSAGGFTQDGRHALFADKFGDILVGAVPTTTTTTTGEGQQPPEAAAAGGSSGESAALQVPTTLLGHFCTIVTGVAPSPCGRFLATGDREYKIRISSLPADPTQISYEIQGYCLGHQDFVSCIAFAVRSRDSEPRQQEQLPESVLLSGSGDGTVRVWDVETCAQLSSYTAAAPAAAAAETGPAAAPAPAAEGGERDGSSAPEGAAYGDEAAEASGGADDEEQQQEEEEDEEEDATEAAAGGGGADGGADGFVEPQRRSKAPTCAPVLSLAVAPDGCSVAVVVEGDDEVQLLRLDWSTRSLALRQRLRWPDVRYPCQVAFGPEGQMWVLGGVPLPTARSVHIGVARPTGPDGTYEVCTDQVLPPPLRAAVEARQEEEEAKMAEGGELFTYSKRFRRPTYDEAEVQTFKRQRSDFKESQRLAALRLRQDEQAKQKQQGQKAQEGEEERK